MMATIVFAALAAVALLAAALAVWRGPTTGRLGRALKPLRPALSPVALALALAGVMLLYEASGLALVASAAVGAAALVLQVTGAHPREGAPEEPAPALGRARLAAAAAVTGGLVFVLVGTWARQFVWTGRELPPGSGFGELPGLAQALLGAPGLLGVGLVIVVAAAACAGPPRHRI
jgi:hypothetical protein